MMAGTAKCLALAAMIATGVAHADQHPLWIQAEVTVTADGTVSDATVLRPQLPKSIEAAALRTIRDMSFRPITIEGQAATVTSQLSFSACVRETDGNLDLGMQLSNIGPQSIQPSPPPLPRALLVSGETRTDLLIDFVVKSDGTTDYLGMSLESKRLRSRQRDQVENEFRRWIETTRFSPERVNGKAVATRMEWPVTITVSTSKRPHKPESLVQACDIVERPASNGPRVTESAARIQPLPSKSS